ncbi:MAG: RsmE family RNA methyltransferase [Flexibacteraceae bacterium]
MELFYHPNPEKGIFAAEESKHIAKVLRYEIGDRITLTNGKGTRFSGRVTDNNFLALKFQVESQDSGEQLKPAINLIVAPLKHQDRMEWLVEKVVEIGVANIYFWPTQRAEKQKPKLERFEKIAISAIKQSKQDWLPKIALIGSLSDVPLATINLIAHLEEGTENRTIPSQLSNKPESINVLIGPEGDFTQQEINQALALKYQAVTLGTNVLRTETAAMVACASIRQHYFTVGN